MLIPLPVNLQKRFTPPSPVISRDPAVLAAGTSIGSTDSFVRLNNDHLKLMVTIAHQAAIVIENSEFNSAVIHSERLSAVGETLSAMSHHIKNIMQGINCGEHLLDEGLATKDLEAVESGWEIVQRNQREMSQLVLDMLTVSKKKPPHLQVRDVVESVARAINDIKPETRATGISVKFEGARNRNTDSN